MATHISHVTKRDGQVVPFDRSKIKSAIHKAILATEPKPKMDPDCEAERFTSEVVTELGKRCAVGEAPHIEKIQDALLDMLHADIARGSGSYSSIPESLWMSYMLYREGHTMVRNGHLKQEHFRRNTKPVHKLKELKEWNAKHRCDTMYALNDWFSDERVSLLINESEARSTAQLLEMAADLGKGIKEGRIKAVIVTGPSSSGKTTTCRKALRSLTASDPILKVKALEVDNYFKSHDHHEKLIYNVDGKQITDINFELPQSYDIALINEHLESIMKGETVMVPHYNFSTGKRDGEPKPFKLDPGEILLIDSLHALSPQLTEAIPMENKFRLYLEPLSVLSDNHGNPVFLTDIRLLRRMIRDVRSRGYPTEATLWHWHLVRKGERFIIPYLHSADYVLDSGLPYELPILKHFLEKSISDLLPIFERNPDLYDGRERARRVMRMFSQLKEATPEQIALVPRDSILREFIGGSEFFDFVQKTDQK